MEFHNENFIPLWKLNFIIKMEFHNENGIWKWNSMITMEFYIIKDLEKFHYENGSINHNQIPYS